MRFELLFEAKVAHFDRHISWVLVQQQRRVERITVMDALVHHGRLTLEVHAQLLIAGPLSRAHRRHLHRRVVAIGNEDVELFGALGDVELLLVLVQHREVVDVELV